MRPTALLLAILLVTFPAVASPDETVVVTPMSWSELVNLVSKSTYKISMEMTDGHTGEVLQGYCTGWSINELKGLIVTAAHCEGNNMKADGIAAEVLYVSTTTDLMVLQTSLKKPALKPSTRKVNRGDDLLAFGYGYGFDEPLAKTCKVASPDQIVNQIEEGERFLISDCAYVKGMSGGPVVDRDGKIISIVQLGAPDNATGLGRVLRTIRSVVGYYGRE